MRHLHKNEFWKNRKKQRQKKKHDPTLSQAMTLVILIDSRLDRDVAKKFNNSIETFISIETWSRVQTVDCLQNLMNKFRRIVDFPVAVNRHSHTHYAAHVDSIEFRRSVYVRDVWENY